MKFEVRDYKGLKDCVNAFEKGAFKVLFIIGNQGQSKSQIVKDVLRKKAQFIEGGSVSAFQFYQELFRYRDHTFVLDDIDSIYTDRTMIRLLKALCQTDDVKTVGWHTANPQLDKNDIPRSFETKTRIVIIANKWHTLNQHVESLEDRGLMVRFEPSNEEVLNEGKKWFKDHEIIRYVENHLDYIDVLSMRHLVVAAEMKQKSLPWKESLQESLGIKHMVIVDNLLRSREFITTEERVKKWEEQTQRGRTNFFEIKRKLEYLRTKKLKNLSLEEVLKKLISDSSKGKRKIVVK